MASKSAPPLPLPLPDYELVNEQITRRTIEQLFQDVFSDINKGARFKFFAANNSEHNEIIWFYASSSSTEINLSLIHI